MTWREIPFAEWPSFLEQFSHEHRAWLAEVERTASGGGAPMTTTRRFITASTEIEHNRATIALRFHCEGDAQETLRVPGPAVLRAEETLEGTVQGLDIEVQDGERVRLRFRGVAQPDVFLDGIAPGELT